MDNLPWVIKTGNQVNIGYWYLDMQYPFVGSLKSNNPLLPAYIPSIFYIHLCGESRKEKGSGRTWLGMKETRQVGREGLNIWWRKPWIWAWNGSTNRVRNDSFVHGIYWQARGGKSAVEGGNSSLKDVIAKREVPECSLKDNQTNVKFYTGLPSFAILMAIFDFVACIFQVLGLYCLSFSNFSWYS